MKKTTCTSTSPDLPTICKLVRDFNCRPDGLSSLKRPCPPMNWSARPVGTDGKTMLLEVYGVSFLVWDNGGELGCEKVNSGEPRFAPLTYGRFKLNEVTMAYRLAALIRDEVYSYSTRFPDELQKSILDMMAEQLDA